MRRFWGDAMSESDYMDICEQLSRDLALAREEIERLRGALIFIRDKEEAALNEAEQC